MRGFRNPVCGIFRSLRLSGGGAAGSLRIQLDDQVLVDRRGQVGARRYGLEGALQRFRVHFEPFRDMARGRGVGLAELALEQPVDAARLLLLAQLLAVVREPRPASLAVLPRGVAAPLDRAFVGEALFALQEELLALPAALAALGVDVPGHSVSSLHAPALRRST